MKKIAIIGGGAAGMAAAISAAHELQRAGEDMGAGTDGASASTVAGTDAGDGASVVVFEAADRMGKSILASGNGRCNFSNADLDLSAYHNASFVEEGFRALPPEQVLDFFSDLGLMWHEEGEGRLYPLTNKASTMLDVLRFAAAEAGVEQRCGSEAIAVTPVRHQLLVSLDDGRTDYFDAVVIACGGRISRSIVPPGYHYANTQPMLGPLKTDVAPIRGLNNIRVRCAVSCGDHREQGELLFRDYGVSGIAVFNLSRYAHPGEPLLVDFLPDTGEPELGEILGRRVAEFGDRAAADMLAGMLQPLVARAVLKAAGLATEAPLPHSDIPALAAALKAFELRVEGIGEAKQCQVRRGGFAVDDFDPATLESKLDPGLFLVGEALDVDGPCGGYNLHWAWASGLLAGRAAARRVAGGHVND